MEQNSSRNCDSESCSESGELRAFTDYSDTVRRPRIDVCLCENHYLRLMNQDLALTYWFKGVLARKQASYR